MLALAFYCAAYGGEDDYVEGSEQDDLEKIDTLLPQLTALGLAAGSYRLEYATNLSPTNPANWQPLVTFSAPPNSQSFADATATNSLSRFYRLVLLP